MSVQREPLRVTLRRTLLIAVIVSGVVSLATRHLDRWPRGFVVMLWPALGGHYVELAYLRGVQPWIYPGPARLLARMAVWFFGGIGIGAGMLLTAELLGLPPKPAWVTWWSAGLGFVALELVVHAVLALRRLPNAYVEVGSDSRV